MQPIVASGRVFFGSLTGMNDRMAGTMFAVDGLTGDNKWDYQTGGAIMGTASYVNGLVIFGSMDGKIYAIDDAASTAAGTGKVKWTQQTGAGLTASPIASNGVVYVGSRDGKFYAIDANTGAIKWSYAVRDSNNTAAYNNAPIISAAALSEDGSTVFFGAENMNFYALATATGTEKWAPKKLIGQSFLYSWPVVKGNYVIVRTMSSLPGAEEDSTFIHPYLDAICPGGPTSSTCSPTWAQEKAAIMSWLSDHPEQKTMYILDGRTGAEPYQVAMGRVTGNNYAPHAAVIDNQNRLLTYWRSVKASFFTNPGTFGSIFCPDISELNLATGDRVLLNNSAPEKCPEIDNGFQLTVGGDYLYSFNSFRGSYATNLTTGKRSYIANITDYIDGGHTRYTFPIVYWGNDTSMKDIRPWGAGNAGIGFTGITVASVNTVPMLYLNDAEGLVIAGIEHQ